jgi:hypothetical protein
MRRRGHKTSTAEKRHAYRALVGIPERKTPLESHRHTWEYIIVNLKETEWEGIYWIIPYQVGKSCGLL